MNTVKSTLPTEQYAVRQAGMLNKQFRPQFKSVFTGELRVASDGKAWMGEFIHNRRGQMVTTWYRLMTQP